MSEYQYYEFQAIDKALNEQQMQELRNLSTRAQITATSFVNTYNWGDFRGEPLKLVEKYFDAFLYFANWGTRWLMLRIPRKLLSPETVNRYCVSNNTTVYVKEEHLILEFCFDSEDYDWVDGEGWLSSLISLRSDLIHGDYRCLYLAWLFCVQMGELDGDEVEPLVPSNLGTLTASLKSFADFLKIDSDLIEVATQGSIPEDKTSSYHNKLKSWINKFPDTEKNRILFRLINDNNPHLGAELWQRFQQTLATEDVQITGSKPRTVKELLRKAQIRTEERKRRIAEQKAKEDARLEQERQIARQKYLTELATREDAVWRKVETLIETRQPSPYDEAGRLLADLGDIARTKEKVVIFEEQLQNLRTQHSKKSSLIRRLNNIKMGL